VRLVAQDGAVEGRGAAVADDARMHHETEVPPPDILRDRPAQIGREDQVGPEQVHRLARDLVVDVELHRRFVPRLGQFHVQALGQAVEGVGEQQDAHGR
jgi:hypothetical protein